MATATLKHGAHKLLGHNKPATTDSSPVDSQKCQQEKQFIANFYDNARPLPPDQIADSPRNKELATSSQQLRIQDFELIKTLGTGEWIFEYPRTASGIGRLNISRNIRESMARDPSRRVKKQQ